MDSKNKRSLLKAMSVKDIQNSFWQARFFNVYCMVPDPVHMITWGYLEITQ